MSTNIQRYEDTVRVDRHLYQNLTDIERTYKEDSMLVKDIMIYLAHRLKTDLFGYSTFSMADFCKTMGYQKSHLQARHPRTSDEKEEVMMINGRRYDNVLEHTLFQMVFKSIKLTRSEKIGSKGQDSISRVNILKEINIHYDVNKPDRRIYEVKLDGTFLERLLAYYINISLSDYRAVSVGKGKEKITNLYLLLSGLRNGMIHRNEKHLTPNFKLLCDTACITSKEPKHQKSTLKKYLEEIAQKTNLKYTTEFVADRNQRHAYSILLTFDVSQIYAESYKEKQFFDTLLEKLKQHFNVSFPAYVEKENYYELFQKWLNNRSYDVDGKAAIIEKTRKQVYMSTYDKTNDEVLIELCKLFQKSLLKPDIKPSSTATE